MSTPPEYTPIICIGLGMSGICLGAQLKSKYGMDFKDIHFYDRNTGHSGTWWVNRYPGAACDVPAVFYSFSFAPNPSWTQFLPTHSEIRRYVDGVVHKYQLAHLMTFRTECESAVWDSIRQRWIVSLRDLETGKTYVHECKVLFSAVGMLVEPMEPEIPGRDTFKGTITHTARWREDIELKGKDTIIVGNGCSGSQVVPQIVSQTKTLTQFIHTPHWLIPLQNPTFGAKTHWVLNNIPLIQRLFRFIVFLWTENDWRLFRMNKAGARFRRATEKVARDYVQRAAPEKYRELLIPDWEIACKRRIFDANELYLNALHAPNFELLKDDVVEILPHAVRTATKTYPADVIILATGFRTHNVLGSLKVQGRDGEMLHDHWKKRGGPGAYHTTAVHGFPNFFLLYGPNSNTGHTSVLMTTENTVNYAMKIITPVLSGKASEVEVKADAERDYVLRVQAVSKTRIISKCSNWYISKEGWNSTTYPWSQVHYWWTSTFPNWHDWEYKYTSRYAHDGRRSVIVSMMTIFALGLIGVSAVVTLDGTPLWKLVLEYIQRRWALWGN